MELFAVKASKLFLTFQNQKLIRPAGVMSNLMDTQLLTGSCANSAPKKKAFVELIYFDFSKIVV
jgi:hypothetical protein